MKTFKQYFLLNEITENTILYHRSSQDFQPGQVINPSVKFGTGHWLSEKFIEQKLEEFRKKYAPDKPSRFNCIYTSVVPRSVFLKKAPYMKLNQ